MAKTITNSTRLSSYILFLFSLCLVCCDADSEINQSKNEIEDTDPVISTRRKEIIEALKGTTWRQISNTTTYQPSGRVHNVALVNEPITFSSNTYSTELNDYFPEYKYRLYVGSKLIGFWTVTKKYELYTRADLCTPEETGEYVVMIGIQDNVEFIGNTMICTSFNEHDDFTTYNELKYTKINSDVDSGSDHNGTTYEAPEIGFYDYTATKSSLKVQFKIYNASDAKVQSAKVYYGKNSASSSVSAMVSGTIITAYISGLSSGTVYYVKCRATGAGGTTTTDQIRCITSYY